MACGDNSTHLLVECRTGFSVSMDKETIRKLEGEIVKLKGKIETLEMCIKVGDDIIESYKKDNKRIKEELKGK